METQKNGSGFTKFIVIVLIVLAPVVGYFTFKSLLGNNEPAQNAQQTEQTQNYENNQENTAVNNQDYGENVQVGDDNDNSFQGDAGNNVYEPKGGNDSFWDDQGGDDTYIIGLNEGWDWIMDLGGNDTIVFKEGITPDIIKMNQNENGDLVIMFNGYEGGIIVSEYFKDNEKKIENFKFADGNVVTDISAFMH